MRELPENPLRVLVAGLLVALLLATFHRALTRVFVLNFSTAGPNATALLTLGLLSGWSVGFVPAFRRRPRAVTAVFVAAGTAVALATLTAPTPALLAALLAHLLLLPALLVVVGDRTAVAALGAATGLALFAGLRAWLDTAPAYATPAGRVAVVVLALAALAGWLSLHRGAALDTGDDSRGVSATPLVAFLLAGAAFLASPAAVAVWSLRSYPLVAAASVAGLLLGGWVVLDRGPPDDFATVAWLLLFLAGLVDLLWVDAVGGASALPTLAAAVVLLARGTARTAEPPLRAALAATAVQALGVVLVFLHVSALNWAFMPAPLDSLTRDRLPWFLFGACLLFGLVVAVTLRSASPAPTSTGVRPDRRSVLGLVGAGALGLFGVAAREATAGVRSADPSPLRVATFNVHQYAAPGGEYNLRALAALLREQDPHVVGLQESDSGRVTAGGFDGVRWLAHRLGYHFTFGTPTGDGSYGAALLSRWPVERERVVYLPVRDSPPRPALVATVAHPDGPLPVVVTHFQTGKPGDRRLAEAERIVALTDAFDRAVVLGDFNLQPDHPGYRTLDGALTDAWTAADRRSGDGATYSAAAPRRRIDYVWLKGDWAVDRAWTAGSPAASDHLAVIASIRPENHE